MSGSGRANVSRHAHKGESSELAVMLGHAQRGEHFVSKIELAFDAPRVFVMALAVGNGSRKPSE